MDEMIPQDIPQGKHYVYTLSYPDDYPDKAKAGTVFYVGKGTGKRIHAHEREASRGVKGYKCNVIRKIWEYGCHVVKQKLAYFHTHKDACQYEIALIFFLSDLTNRTSGGDGVSNPTEEVRRKIGEARKRHTMPFTEETRRKLGEATRRRGVTEKERQRLKLLNKGRVHTEESKRHMSEAHKGNVNSEETRQKMSKSLRASSKFKEAARKRAESQKGKPRTEETRRKIKAHPYHSHRPPVSEDVRKKISTTLKGRPLTEETRQKMKGRIPANKGKRMSDEVRQAISERQKGKDMPWLHTPEVYAKTSAAMKGRKHSEETRAKMREAWVRRKQKAQDQK